MLFSTFSRQYLGLKNNQNYAIKVINHILCFLQPFFSSKSQSPAFRKEWNDKSPNADSKNTFSVLSSCCPLKKPAQQCLLQFLWSGPHFSLCESLGSSHVKMSQAFYDPLIWFNFLNFHRKVNTFKTPEMRLYLDSDIWAGCLMIIFAGSFHYFKPVSCWILARVVQRLDNAIQRISVNKTNHAIHWTVIYSVDSLSSLWTTGARSVKMLQAFPRLFDQLPSHAGN